MKRMEFIAQEVIKNKHEVGAEVGVFKGSTFFYLLKSCPELKKMIAVDPWKVRDERGQKVKKYSGTKWDIEEAGKKVREEAKKFGDRAVVLHMTSLQAAEKIEDGSLDFVHVDGDHRLSFVRADIAAWYPKVRYGGMLFGHDWNLKPVRVAVKTMFGNRYNIHEAADLWYAKRSWRKS